MNVSRNLFIILLLILGGCGITPNKDNTSLTDSIPPELKTLNYEISKNEDNPQLYLKRAQFYFSKKDYDLAFRDLQFTLDSDKNNIDALIMLAQVYINQGNAQKALETINKALVINPDHIKALTTAAEINLILKNYLEVFENLDKALIQDKRNPKAFYLRGFAFLESGDTINGIKNLKVASDQDPANYEANWLLGLTFAEMKSSEAIIYFNKAIGIQPRNSDFYYQLALYFQNNDLPEKALETYRTIIQIDSNYKSAYFNSGYIYLVVYKDFSKAAEHFTRAIQKDQNYSEAYFNRGFCHENMKQYERARSDYQTCLKIQPNYEKGVEALNRLDRIQFKLK